jgi:hypothetical protein
MNIRLLFLAIPLFAAALPMHAQAPAAPPSPLPVRQVTLFTSGVSYTERAGEVDGNAAVPLVFRTAQINDILKSMVLIDEAGRVRPATYTARDPISRTLQSFAVDVTQNLSMEQILAQLRGAKVAVDVDDKVITGQIVGVETRVVAVQDGKPFVVQVLNLLTETGLTSLRFDRITTLRLLDERLNREFREALGLLATGADEQRRQVTLHFAGNGKRTVHVGYVTEAPLWKMSYRLLMGGKAQDNAQAKPYIQGWALVENTTDDDWDNIRLTLVSGRPVSFIQDLYQPLYIPRPVVANDVIASPFPQTHGSNLEAARPNIAIRPEGVDSVTIAPGGPPANRPMAGGGMGGGMGGMGFGGRRGGVAGEALKTEALNVDNSLIVRQSVATQAAGDSAGELFQYRISTPVSLPRQQAAMIPVVAEDIQAEKLSLFNADTGSRFPLNAVRIKNTTGLHLKGGPITLFDEGVYAGDAKMEDIPPADSRLVSYAVDMTVEGERQGPAITMIESAMSLRRGVLTVSRREKVETTYTLKSKDDKPKTILVEHPFQPEYKLLSPAKPEERTAQLYRFAVAVAPGKSETLKVVTERPISQMIAVLDVELDSLAVYANRKEISQKLRETLQEVVQRRRKVQELQAQAQALDTEIGAITADQDRIRKNMTSLDRASALYKRYVTELDAQETRIQNLRKEAASLRKQAADAERDLRAYLDTITITD